MSITESRSSRDDDNDIPPWLRWTFVAINRVGFPVVASIFMGYLCIQETKAINRMALSVEALEIKIDANHSEGKEWRVQMLNEIRDSRRNQ